MSDYLGPNQPRVLDTTDRNYESVVYQRRKPPLSCEVNLGGKIDEERTQLVVKGLMPSGVLAVEAIQDGADASSCPAGSVICNPTFLANSFKFVGLDKGQDAQRNIAWVNGWKIIMQGTNSSDEDNIITLATPPLNGTRVDFVFLEVWRKLITPSDVIYKYGNVLYGGTNYSNDLIDPTMGIETSLRIQIQYRIRSAQINYDSYPDGFDPNTIFVQGPLPAPISTCDQAYFTQVPGDPGLWYAGAGDDVAQETIGTVDGHTYAIPLFAIRRRNTSAYDPDTKSNGALRSLSDYISGTASDRPDNYYNDWIVAEDILDMRHKVIPQENVKELCEDAFKKLINDRLPGKITKSTLGGDNYGITIVQPDAVSNVDMPGSSRIGQGDGVRRAFSNAQVTQSENFIVRTIYDKSHGTIGGVWTAGDQIQIVLTGYPTGSQITGLTQVYTKQSGALTYLTDYTITSLPSGSLTITINGGVLGTSYNLILEYVLQYSAGPNGLTEVPKLFLEARMEGSSNSIAMQDIDIRARSLGPIITNDGTKFTMLTNRGASITEQSNFGHQMVHHVVGNGSSVFTVPRTLGGYEVIGFSDITYGGSLQNNPLISRDSSTYTVNITPTTPTVGSDIQMTLYTGTKFFEGNKQGRGITDCWEMHEIIPDEVADGTRTSFHIDGTSKQLLALASYSGEGGAGYVYINGVRQRLVTTNSQLPYDSTKTYGTLTFSAPPVNGAIIESPVLTRSAIMSTEGYTFFYKTLPYQGLLDNSAIGVIEASGTPITTTAGSGAITNYTYSVGQARFNDSTVVDGNGTEWLSNAKAGQLIVDSSSREYIIKEVYSDAVIFLNVIPDFTSTSWVNYTITEKDQAFFLQRNVIDLLPTYSALNDSSGTSASISMSSSEAYPILESQILSRVQDIEGLPKGYTLIGINSADRGRSTVHIDSTDLAPLCLGNLGLKFEKIDATSAYHKTYQGYILNKDDSGRLYLMVVGSETDNTSSTRCFFNQASNKDSVDIFELPGKPVLMRRLA
jgi:hypothetical protein